MPRNGSGTMSVTNSFSANTTISSSEMNANFSDFASEVTNSLPRDGQAAMTGVLKVSAGTAAAPAVVFSTDTDTGIYRVGANTLGIACGGAIVGQFDSTGAKTGTGENYDAFAAGTSMVFYQAAAPTGWTAEAINDKALRVVSSGGTGGTDGGTTAFSSVLTARTIAQANLPNVNFTVTGTTNTTGAHTHTVTSCSDEAAHPTGTGRSDPNDLQVRTTSSNGDHSHTVTGTAASGGSGTALDFAIQYSDVIIATKD